MEQKDTLSRLREQRGLTQQEVAEELGVSRQAVSQWEAGKTFPSMEKQLALSRLYGVSLEELYRDGAAQDKEVEAAIPSAGNEEEEKIPEKYPFPGKQRMGKKKIVLLAVLVSIYILVYVIGILTRSKSMATSTLRFLTAVTISVWLLYLLYRRYKKG